MDFSSESISVIFSEGVDLIRDHWSSIAVNRDKIPLNPDWGRYVALEDSGILRTYVAREGGELVGYYVALLHSHLHYADHSYAVCDMVYLRPRSRRGLAGLKLLRYAEQRLTEDGASVVLVHTKTHANFGPVMRRLGYTCVESVYSKYVGRG